MDNTSRGREDRQRPPAHDFDVAAGMEWCGRGARRWPPVLLEPRVGCVGGAGEGLGAGAAAAQEAALRGAAHPPELLALAPQHRERRLADVAAVEARTEEAARVHVALHRNRADVCAGP